MGSSQVASAWLSADRRVSSLLLYPETRAAIARAQRMGRLGARGMSQVERRVDGLWAALDRLAITEELARWAGGLAHTHGLRAYDAVHLASAASVADDEFVLVAADSELIAAARAIGIATAELS
jgi:predicted nucleic acid-binding protein